MLQVLIDADNVLPRRIRPVLDLLAELGTRIRVTVSGRQHALDQLDWPAGAQLLAHAGWQQADLALANAYSPSDDPLLLISGDGDFGLLAANHPGQVLVVSGAASNRLRQRRPRRRPGGRGGRSDPGLAGGLRHRLIDQLCVNEPYVAELGSQIVW